MPMEIFKRIKQLVKEVDLFAQVPAYRYNQDPDFKTATGGFISLITILFFIGVFANTFVNTLNKKQVSFTISRFAQQSPTYYATTLDKSFLFAIGLNNIDLNDKERYFDISMQFRQYTPTDRNKKNNIQLSQCKRSTWESRGYGDKYDRLGLQKWLCPPDDIQLALQGKYTSDLFKFYKISVSKCKASTDPTHPCVASQKIQALLNANDVFTLNYYYINTIINAGDSQEDYLEEYLEDVNYFSFTPKIGISANLFISSYSIETDESLWPLNSIRDDAGGIVLDPAQTSIFQVRTGNEYMKLYLRKSPITVAITRSFRKIDQTLSYIGGLFSFLLIFLFFVNKYNEYAFDIQLTRHSYFCNKNQPFDGNFFNFLRFFPFVIYRILDKFKINPDWPAYAKMNQFLEAGRKHLDIRLITKKILLVEKLGVAVLGRNQFEALMLSEPYTLEDAEKIRQSIKFYKRFIKKFPKKSDVQNDPIITTASYILSGKSLPSSKALVNAAFMGPTDIIRNYTIKQTLGLQNPQRFEQLGQRQIRQIRHMQLFNIQISMIKRTLDELQKNMAKGDKIAMRIWNELDDKIKITYNLLNSYEEPIESRGQIPNV